VSWAAYTDSELGLFCLRRRNDGAGRCLLRCYELTATYNVCGLLSRDTGLAQLA
jgi:hypothetical protein